MIIMITFTTLTSINHHQLRPDTNYSLVGSNHNYPSSRQDYTILGKVFSAWCPTTAIPPPATPPPAAAALTALPRREVVFSGIGRAAVVVVAVVALLVLAMMGIAFEVV
jgi:hypothetical protein